MSKLYLRFDQKILKEIVLSHGVVTIGRLPDNLVQLDNPAVSGHHARIYWIGGHYAVEDEQSLNGIFLNNRRISQSQLQDGDVILVGKHTLEFRDSWADKGDARSVVDRAPHWQQQLDKASPPKLEPTVVLGTKAAQQMMGAAAKMAENPSTGAQSSPANADSVAGSRVRAGHTVGTLAVVAGNTDRSSYLLADGVCAIGKSEMATVRLKGWFAPQLAAVIQRREDAYIIAASRTDVIVKVNGSAISGQAELQEADLIEVARVKLKFAYERL